MGWELLRPDQAFVHASNRFSRFHCLISLFISDLCFCLFMVCDSFKDGCHVAREDQSEEAEQARHHPNLVSDDLCSSILCLIHEDESVDLFFLLLLTAKRFSTRRFRWLSVFLGFWWVLTIYAHRTFFFSVIRILGLMILISVSSCFFARWGCDRLREESKAPIR